MRLSGPQIEAAIVLAKMTREGMCKKAQIAKNTLNDIINEKTAYREDTIKKIRSILEARGIEFLPSEGVRKKEQIITTITGDDCLKELLLDIYNTLQSTGGELLIAHLSEGEAAKDLEPEFLADQIRKRKAANITHRLLVKANDPKLIPPFDTYHALPDEFFSSHPLYLYGPKLAMRLREPEKVVIIDDGRFAECVRKLFDFAWVNTKMPEAKAK